MFESVAQLAARAHTHGSTLVRLAQKLGYSGFPELRSALQAELISSRRTDDLIRARLKDSKSTDLLPRLLEREIAALTDVTNFISQADIDAAADRILAADRITVIAEGTAEALARHATHRLRRAGKVMLQLQPDPRSLAEGATLLRTGDVAIGFALRLIPPLLAGYFDHVRAQGGVTILVSDLSGLSLRPSPDHLLAASRGNDMESGTLTVPMALLNALILTCAERGQPDTLSALKTYTDIRDDLT